MTTLIELSSIKLAMQVSEHLSIRRTAIHVGLQSSTVSRRIRALEDKLGVSLFERYNGGVRLTAAGQRFMDRAEFALSSLDYAVKSAAVAGRGAEGRLRIGIFSSLASHFPRTSLAAFLSRYPNVDVDVVESAPRLHMAKVRDRRLDVALVTGTPAINDLDVEEFWRERVYVALPAGHSLEDCPAIAWNDLLHEHFIVSRQEPGPEIHDYIIRRIAELGHHPSVVRYEVGRENLMHLVALGLGISLTSEATIATRYPSIVFRPIASPADVLPFSAVWCSENDNPALRRFLSLMRTLAGGNKSCHQA